eukprot:4089520-Prymnesium_polylepis.1
MMRRVAVSGATRAPRCRGWHDIGLWCAVWPMAYGLWCAVRRYSDATRFCGAFGTRYVTMRGLIGSRRVPSG